MSGDPRIGAVATGDRAVPPDRLSPSRARFADLQRNLLDFCRLLRERELLVGPSEVIDALRTARAVDLADRDELKLALRCVLTARPEDLSVFDMSFEEFWRTRGLEGGDDHFTTRQAGGRGKGQQQRRESLDGEAKQRPSQPDDDDIAAPVSSSLEVLAHRNFESFQADELAAIQRTIRVVARRLATRVSRRWRPSRRGNRIDLRRSLRQNMKYGGVIVELAYKRRAIRKPHIVLICDVSRSMQVYTVFLLQFIYALQHTLGKIESFVFSTRLTRVTDYFRTSTIHVALERIAAEVPDWAGGTRIGDSLHTFNRDWALRVVDQRTVVLLLSDGLDSGHWSVLDHEMAEIARRAERVIWLNPLLASTGYRPIARGMRAALPHVTLFATAHDLASLQALVRQLAG